MSDDETPPEGTPPTDPEGRSANSLRQLGKKRGPYRPRAYRAPKKEEPPPKGKLISLYGSTRDESQRRPEDLDAGTLSNTERHHRTTSYVRTTERGWRAFELRKQGASYRQIADALKISHTLARRDVKRVLSEIRVSIKEDLEDYRQLELERLDFMLMAIAPQVRAGSLPAIDRALKIGEQRMLLLGVMALAKDTMTGMAQGTLDSSGRKKDSGEGATFIEHDADTRRMLSLAAAIGFGAGRASTSDGTRADESVYTPPAHGAPTILLE
jgi:hypothetical protein